MKPPIKNTLVRTVISFLFVVYIFILIKFILVKNPADLKSHFIDDYGWTLLEKNFCEGNYIPLRTFNYYLAGTSPNKFSTENLLGNMFLFMPFGLFLPLLFHKTRGLSTFTFVCFLVSLSLETIQLATALGTFDVDDILLNTFGGLMGFSMYAGGRYLLTNI